MYAKDFYEKGYILANKLGRGETACVSHEGEEYYAIVSRSVQMHGSERTAKKLIAHKDEKQSLEASPRLEGLRNTEKFVVSLPQKQIASLSRRHLYYHNRSINQEW